VPTAISGKYRKRSKTNMAAKKAAVSRGPKLPKGYTPARVKLDGFFAREKGNTVHGILRGSFKVKGKFGEKRVFRIEVVEGETQVGEGEMVGPGAVIGLDETGYTKVLGELDPGTGIFVGYEGKAGAGEKDAHVFAVGIADA